MEEGEEHGQGDCPSEAEVTQTHSPPTQPLNMEMVTMVKMMKKETMRNTVILKKPPKMEMVTMIMKKKMRRRRLRRRMRRRRRITVLVKSLLSGC